jgi:salicylate hydroxylase
MRALIVGAGISGLSVAIALAKKGWTVNIIEKSHEIRGLGAGIQVSPNGLKILDDLGVTKYIENSLFEPDNLELRLGQSGKKIFSIPFKEIALKRWGARYINVHRDNLIMGFLSAIKNFKNIKILTNETVVSYDIREEFIILNLGSGEKISGDLVIGADGLNSTIRMQMLYKDHPTYTGYMAWRCLAPMDKLGDTQLKLNSCVWVGKNKHAVTTVIDGGKTINFVGVVLRDIPVEESWNAPGTKIKLLQDFEGWHPFLKEIIQNSKSIFQGGLYEREPIKTWTNNKVVLLGDSAHPMLPSMAQGASQALEDSACLASFLTSKEDISRALNRFFEFRIRRVSKIQKRSRKNLKLFHLSNIVKRSLFFGILSLLSKVYPESLHKGQDWVYGYELNKKYNK